ncbi:MAG: GlsB/YeaQ/YmgE family stress response membrane protein [Betaproteobacteria bacterium]|nr:GlsB/YeaQ/YmgE family stress response membrane protein [Betaproteobacteria bacterium]
MNIAMWILAGGVLGWMGYVFLNANERRGLVVSIIIGAVGAFAGGNMLAPMLGAVVETTNEFSLLSMVIALASAAALLAVGNLVFNRFHV